MIRRALPLYSAARLALTKLQANVAELVDALDLGSSGVTREGSSPSFRTSPDWFHNRI